MLIDAHCHFFTKNMLTERLLIGDRMGGVLSRVSERRNQRDKLRNLRLFSGMNMADFMRIGYENSAAQLYEIMAECYGGDFIAIPLMLDVSFALMAPKGTTAGRLGRLSWRGEAAKRAAENGGQHVQANALERRLDIWERAVLGFDLFENAYQRQIDDLIEIKQAMPNRVYPFFSIDPRRENEFEGGVLSEIKRYIGNDKPFKGLKLYSSLGYSPTHPVLYDNSKRESVYGYCEKNKIPVTVHAALEGFSHMLRYGEVEGDIYLAEEDTIVPAKQVYEDGLISFKHRLRTLDFDSITQERVLMMNHPVLWRKVLERYPKLKLNMAHFGGILEMDSYLRDGNNSHWAMCIVDIMRDFSNVYTDLSFFYEDESRPDFLQRFYEDVFCKLPRRIRSRIMYGSDYYMFVLYDAGLKEYIEAFRNVFGRDFTQISERNARRFLNI